MKINYKLYYQGNKQFIKKRYNWKFIYNSLEPLKEIWDALKQGAVALLGLILIVFLFPLLIIRVILARLFLAQFFYIRLRFFRMIFQKKKWRYYLETAIGKVDWITKE